MCLLQSACETGFATHFIKKKKNLGPGLNDLFKITQYSMKIGPEPIK